MADLQTEHETHEAEQHAEHHIVSPVTYLIIFGTLLVGTALTIAASYWDVGPWNPVIAIGIACAKATLVVLFFMHIKYSS